MKNFITTGIALLLFVRSVCCAEPPISIEELSSILGYPANKLKVEDVTEDSNKQALRKGRPTYISGHTYTGDFASFARVSIGIAAEGTLLTEEMKLKMNEGIEKMTEEFGTNHFFRWLSFEDVGYGVSGFGMVGAGGSDQRTFMTLYGKSDIVISLQLGEEPLEVLPGAEKYNELVREGGIQEKMVELLTLVASKSAGRSVTMTAGSVLPTKSSAPATIPKLTPGEPAKTNKVNLNQSTTPVEPSKPEPALDLQATPTPESSSYMKPLLIALVVIFGFAGAFLILRARKQG